MLQSTFLQCFLLLHNVLLLPLQTSGCIAFPILLLKASCFFFHFAFLSRSFLLSFGIYISYIYSILELIGLCQLFLYIFLNFFCLFALSLYLHSYLHSLFDCCSIAETLDFTGFFIYLHFICTFALFFFYGGCRSANPKLFFSLWSNPTPSPSHPLGRELLSPRSKQGNNTKKCSCVIPRLSCYPFHRTCQRHSVRYPSQTKKRFVSICSFFLLTEPIPLSSIAPRVFKSVFSFKFLCFKLIEN